MSDILQEISDDKLETLRDLFKSNWPHALHAYYMVDNYIDWKKRNLTNIKFYSPEGKWVDGTFIAIDEAYRYCVLLFTTNCIRLKDALRKTNLIKWKEISFCVIHEDNLPTLIDEIKNQGMNIEHQDNGKLWWISKEDALNYEYNIPEEVYLSDLTEKDVEKIDSVWPHRSSTSKQYLKEIIENNGGFGLYLKSDNTLCSWIMRNNYGGMAILQTDEKHKRKGYGTILSKYFSKYWAEKGLDIFCFIMTHNKLSQELFEKLGWKQEHGINWLHCNKK